MEARVMKMESELRVLRTAMARVPQSILRELTARGALLVVQAPAEELENVVAKGIQDGMLEEKEEEKEGSAMVVVEEEEEEKEQEGGGEEEDKEEDRTCGGDEEEAKAVTVELREGVEPKEEEQEEEEEDEEEKAWGCDEIARPPVVVEAMASESSDSDDDDSDDSSSDDEEEEEAAAAQRVQVDQREDVDTSQESATSGPVVDSSVVTSPLTLATFDKAIVEPTSTSTTTMVPSRPAVPFALPSVASAPIRPLVLARRHATVEASELTPRPAFMPEPAANRSIVLDLPANFEVQTKDSVPVAWEKWCCGDAFRGFPPLRLVTAKHVANKAVLRRLSDLRCAMMPIETLARQNKLWGENLTPQEAASVFKQLAPMLPLSQALPSGRERKKEITWSTALNIMRRGKKRKQSQANDGYISETLI